MKELFRIGLKIAKLLEQLDPVSRNEVVASLCRQTKVVEKTHQGGGKKSTKVVEKPNQLDTSSFLVSESLTEQNYPEELQEIRVFLRKIAAPAELDDPAYWQLIHAWLGGNSGVGYLDELNAYLAWNSVQNGRKKHRNLKAGFRNWLAKSAYWSEQRAQRQAIRRGR